MQRIVEATRGAILARNQDGIGLLIETLQSQEKKLFQLALGTAREFPGNQVDESLASHLAQATPGRAALILQAMAGLGFDEMRMHKPVYVGDTLHCVTEVASVRASASKPDRGIVVYASRLLNQREELVFSIKASTLVARNPALME